MCVCVGVGVGMWRCGGVGCGGGGCKVFGVQICVLCECVSGLCVGNGTNGAVMWWTVHVGASVVVCHVGGYGVVICPVPC